MIRFYIFYNWYMFSIGDLATIITFYLNMEPFSSFIIFSMDVIVFNDTDFFIDKNEKKFFIICDAKNVIFTSFTSFISFIFYLFYPFCLFSISLFSSLFYDLIMILIPFAKKLLKWFSKKYKRSIQSQLY